MALDKQRILTELGSVMNQLQSADCGCMGKMFSNTPMTTPGSANMTNPMATMTPQAGCRHGCYHGHGCHHGYGCGNTQPCSPPCAGEPQPAMNSCIRRPCSSYCNPAKLYADTYNYLNQNLMQPVVNEVYNDLSTITPDNTIMNNNVLPSHGNPTRQNNMGDVKGQNRIQSTPGMLTPMSGPNPMTFSGSGIGNTNTIQSGMGNANQHHMNTMEGMGPQIMSMIMKENTNPVNSSGKGRTSTEPMVIDAPQSPHGHVGVIPFSPQINTGNTSPRKMEMLNPTTQHVTMPNTGFSSQVNTNPAGDSRIQNLAPGSPHARNVNANAPGHSSHFHQHQTYGQHSEAVNKFHNFFPSANQGGDMGFDPMAIAIQMNPANQQMAAMDAIKKIMNNNTVGNNQFMKPSGNTSLANPVPSNLQHKSPIDPTASKALPIDQPLQQQLPGHLNQQTTKLAIPTVGQTIPLQGQQVYTAFTGAPDLNQLQSLNQQQLQPQQQIGIPNTEAVNTGNPASHEQTGPVQSPQTLNQTPTESKNLTQEMIKEPIFPADTSKNCPIYAKGQVCYDYNTLGQPVQMLPAKMFHAKEPNLPQTLSPQPVQSKQSKVKQTVSKTSIMGNRRDSRSQLQHVYHQYKGSQSNTKQNIRNPNQGGTSSKGKLTSAPVVSDDSPRQMPIERTGGDTAIDDIQDMNKIQQIKTKIDDGSAANTPKGDISAEKSAPVKRTRNGLQDMSYPTYYNCSWSFQRRPGYCYR